MPQEHSLYADLSIEENLRFFGRMFCLRPALYQERVSRLLEITRLAPFVTRRAHALSGGMYKKLALACALLHQPEVLFLDEPTNGVDPVSRRELWALIYEFVRQGMTVIVSTPYMDEAERCHRVGLVDGGRLVAEGDPRELIRSLAHETYEVQGGDRSRVQETVEAHPAVWVASPAGARLRIVVDPGCGKDVADAVAPLGASLVTTAPGFEDVFLVRTQERAAA
jgi:ABC-2 type transport system ATP-binding protein